ncbi:hypothetical protein THIOM_000296 [Candidatus Thiomargarita nelsonii]|uniref:Uncharacterized protein n=1 Tax=Candidatus Thiomargarita nelsonii TaxID=1003181 RepID=A0A176S7I4_9GAMM|nr:hypothetical protein THIOM_000296 [Candidatus Thiomargarita nelsonii]
MLITKLNFIIGIRKKRSCFFRECLVASVGCVPRTINLHRPQKCAWDAPYARSEEFSVILESKIYLGRADVQDKSWTPRSDEVGHWHK